MRTLSLVLVLNGVLAFMLYPIVFGQRVVAKVLPQTVLIQARVGPHRGFIGSGVFISKSGHILTVAHLAGIKAKSFQVKMYNGAQDSAHLICLNKRTDLALMRLDHPERMQAVAKLSSRPLVRGQEVIIIGYPYGLEFTVSRGIVSGLDRLAIYNQSDAVSNPGNSGGPVFDRDGRLIGILSAGMPYPFFTGQSLFVKLDLIKDFLEDCGMRVGGRH